MTPEIQNILLAAAMGIAAWVFKNILANRDAQLTELKALVNTRAARLEAFIDATHANELRVSKAEERLSGTALRVAKTEEVIEDVRENMARREDLAALAESLGSRIEDAISRRPPAWP